MNLPPPFIPEESILTGIGSSSGVAIGPAQVFSHKKGQVPSYKLLTQKQVEQEVERFQAATTKVRRKLSASRKAVPKTIQVQANIIDAHLMILDDPLIQVKTTAIITEDWQNAEKALLCTIEQISAILAEVEDEYLSARLADMEMVIYSIISALLGNEYQDISSFPPGAILVVDDINPSELSKLSRSKIAGLATATGGRTSHTAIVSQALQLPTVLGINKLMSSSIANGDIIILDGRTGHLILKPDQATLDFYQVRQRMELSFTAEIVRSTHMPAITLDDRKITVMSNLELMGELPAVMSYGGEGIGLYRSEFMYLSSNTPTEQELYLAYKQVAESTAPHPVTIRTLDLGYDKQPATIIKSPTYRGPALNHALGLRGIRHSLRHQGTFKTQLRAILRASIHGHIRIMLPMVSSLDEIRKTRQIITEVENALTSEGIQWQPNIPLGIMIEVPAAIFIARELANEVDFFSIGTNDLIQYTLAVDRSDPEVANMYQPLHPAIWRMFKTLIDISQETNTPLSICGDMAADMLTAPLLIGLKAETLSMPPVAIPKIKRLIRMAHFAEMEDWAQKVLTADTTAEAARRVLHLIRNRFPEL